MVLVKIATIQVLLWTMMGMGGSTSVVASLT